MKVNVMKSASQFKGAICGIKNYLLNNFSLTH
uniref:ATP synthase F0 subunit 8 n=1 Tax=Staphylinidae sp. BMNH 1274145 TaxID=1796550 RepID=A0A140EGK1_9COLE|nr:ATP synthase F0 subunit 8 [Staphylinidae sp. BMNH 1274145]